MGSGHLEITLANTLVPEPRDDQVVVKVLAIPINPSELGLLLGAADMGTVRALQRDGLPVVTAVIPPAGMRAMAGRVGETMPVGNEGAGLVVKTGASPEARVLLGKTAAMLAGQCMRSIAASRLHSACYCPTAPIPTTARPVSSIL
jgi:NADPH:quinone reductase